MIDLLGVVWLDFGLLVGGVDGHSFALLWWLVVALGCGGFRCL